MTSQAPEIEKTGSIAIRARKAIIGPAAANVAFVMELTLVPLLLPAIQLQLGLSIGDLAWVFNSYGFAVAVGVLLGGWCGDAFNTRKVFGCGVAFFVVGSLMAAASSSFEILIVARAIQGFGAGIFSPLVPLLLIRASPLKPGRMLIVLGSVSGYVAAFAPLFYGIFIERNNWNIAFVFIAIVAIIALIILNGSKISDDSPTSASPPKDYLELVRAPYLWVTFVYVFCTYGSITYFLFRLPIWLSNMEVKTASVGFALTVVWLTFSALSALLRNMVDGPGVRSIMLVAPLLISVGLPLSYYNENLLFILMASVLVGSALACSNAPSTQLILRFAPNGMSAISTSIDITFARLGGIMTVAILAERGFAYAVPAICFLCFVAAICALISGKGLDVSA